MMFNANRFMQIESRFFSLASVLFVLEYINRFISRGKQFFTVVNARNTFTKIPPRWAESVCVCVCVRECVSKAAERIINALVGKIMLKDCA